MLNKYPIILVIINQQVKLAFLFSCYTGLRWVDIKRLEWQELQGGTLITRIIQQKTGKPVVLTLHPIALAILEEIKQLSLGKTVSTIKVFSLPTANGANKVLGEWIKRAGVNKYVTWSCARLSFSILLKDKNVDDITIAYLMGHTTTRQVQQTYKRHKPKDQSEVISHLLFLILRVSFRLKQQGYSSANSPVLLCCS